MTSVARGLGRLVGSLTARSRGAEPHKLIPEATPDEIALMARFKDLTMTGIERQWALLTAVRHLNRAKIAGDIVECGVWRGGNMMLAKALCGVRSVARRFVLFDTFAGMSEPTAADVTHTQEPARERFEERREGEFSDWSRAGLDEVKANFARAGLLDDTVVFVPGRVEQTLRDPAHLPERIALLRLDTDWYESTKVELEVLYPRLASGGILIVDDYGHWLGARKAVDEYFASAPVFMSRIDYTARLVVKP
jgi:O-methyltransferase